MNLFIDTANLGDIEEALKRGFVRGVTTNPSLIAKEPKARFEDHTGNIIDLLKKYQNGAHLSVEVFSKDPNEILTQARRFKKIFKYENLSIKIQVGWDELTTIHTLAREGVSINCTACMTVSQAMMAAQAGARYVSFFWGRIRDGGMEKKFKKERDLILSNNILDADEDFDPASIVGRTRMLIEDAGLESEIIVGSIRGVKDVIEAGVSGAHIVTVPPKFFPDMITHYKTDEVVGQFLTDFQQWMTASSKK